MAKRTELTVGQIWAYNRSRQVHIGDYGFEKVEIMAVEPYKYVRGIGYRTTTSGQGVLVKREFKQWGETRITQEVIQLSQLHMVWDKYEVERAKYESQKSIDELNAKNAKAEKEKYLETIYNPALAELRKTIKDATGKDFTDYIKDARYAYSWEVLPIEVINFLNSAIEFK